MAGLLKRVAGTRCAWIGWLGFVVFCLLSLRVPLSSEVRYIEAGREMVELKDWVVPRLGYVPYFEKPILLYWATAASRLLAGGSSVVVRLPSILAGVVSLLVAWGFARRLGGEALATRAALVLLASAYFLGFGSVLMTDTLFSACLAAAWFFHWRLLESGARRWSWAFWTAVALGFLTKGPLALILVLGSIGFFHVIDARRSSAVQGWRASIVRGARSAWRALAPSIGMIVLAALILPWSILVYLRDPRFLNFFYVRENFQAFFDGSVHHRQYFAFYGLVILMAFAPWSLPAAIGLARALWKELRRIVRGTPEAPRPADRLRAYLAVIVVFTLAFLQVSSAKLASYVLPIVPAMAILFVEEWSAADLERPRWLRWSMLASVLVLIAGAAVYLSLEADQARLVLDRVSPRVVWQIVAQVAVTALAMLTGGIVGLRRFWTGLAICGSAFVLFFMTVSWRLPELELGLNVADLARIVAEREGEHDRVVVSSRYVQDYTLQLAVRHRVGYVGKTRELGMGHFAESTPPTVPILETPYDVSGENLAQNPWLYSLERLRAEWAGPRRIWLFCKVTEISGLLDEHSDVHEIGSSHDARLVSNRP